MKKILLTQFLALGFVWAVAQTSPIAPAYIRTDSIASFTDNTNLDLVGRGTGGVNIEGVYTLPKVDGTLDYLIKTDGSGQWGYVDPTTVGGEVDTSGTPAANEYARFVTGNTIEGRTYAEVRTDLGLVIGTNVQAWDQALDDISGLAVTDGNFIVGNGTNWVAESGSTARTSLGLGSLATLSSINNSNWSGTDLSVANGGSGASTLTGYLKGNGTSAFTASATIPYGDISGTPDLSTYVSAASTFATDNRLLRSDGTGRGAQSSGIAVDDSNNISGVGTIGSGAIAATTGASGATVNVNADELALHGSGTTGLSILSPDASSQWIFFGDASDNDVGGINYDHSSNTLSLRTNGTSSRFSVDGTGAATFAAGITSTTARHTSNSGTGVRMAQYDAEGDAQALANGTDGQVLYMNGSTVAWGPVYDEGTWTPTFENYAGSITINNAEYTRFGRFIHCYLNISLDANADADNFSIAHSSLPDTPYQSSAVKGLMQYAAVRGFAHSSGSSLFLVNYANATLTYQNLSGQGVTITFSYTAQ